MENIYLYLGIGALIVILVIGLSSKQIKARLSNKGLKVNANSHNKKDYVSVKKVKKKSEIDITTKKDQNIDIEDIDNSNINIK